MVVCLIGVHLIFGLGFSFAIGRNLAFAPATLFIFFVCSFYFMAFELRW